MAQSSKEKGFRVPSLTRFCDESVCPPVAPAAQRPGLRIPDVRLVGLMDGGDACVYVDPFLGELAPGFVVRAYDLVAA